jgi:hypothetical protein
MIKLTHILKEIIEAKQVGDIYHFTSLKGLYGILKDGFIKPNSENQISTTRNKNVDMSSFFEYSGGQVTVMLTLDGNKISNKYKVKPFRYDPTFWSLPVYQDKFEFEEQIITNGKNFPIFLYLKSVSITIDNERNLNKEMLDQIENILKEKNIPYEIK